MNLILRMIALLATSFFKPKLPVEKPNPDEPEIPIFKPQIPNKSQTTNDNGQTIRVNCYCNHLEFRTLEIGYYLRFVFCHFGFLIFCCLSRRIWAGLIVGWKK